MWYKKYKLAIDESDFYTMDKNKLGDDYKMPAPFDLDKRQTPPDTDVLDSELEKLRISIASVFLHLHQICKREIPNSKEFIAKVEEQLEELENNHYDTIMLCDLAKAVLDNILNLFEKLYDEFKQKYESGEVSEVDAFPVYYMFNESFKELKTLAKRYMHIIIR